MHKLKSDGALDPFVIFIAVTTLIVGGFVAFRIVAQNVGDVADDTVEIEPGTSIPLDAYLPKEENLADETEPDVITYQEEEAKELPNTALSLDDLGYSLDYPDDWFLSNEETVLTNYDPDRDTTGFSSGELHFGKPGDIKLSFQISNSANGAIAYISLFRFEMGNPDVQDVNSLSGVGDKAFVASMVTENGPLTLVTYEVGEVVGGVVVHGNGATNPEGVSPEVLEILSSIK